MSTPNAVDRLFARSPAGAEGGGDTIVAPADIIAAVRRGNVPCVALRLEGAAATAVIGPLAPVLSSTERTIV